MPVNTRFARLWILGSSAGLYDCQELSWNALWACAVTQGRRANTIARQAIEWASQNGWAVLGAASRLDTREPVLFV